MMSRLYANLFVMIDYVWCKNDVVKQYDVMDMNKDSGCRESIT